MSKVTVQVEISPAAGLVDEETAGTFVEALADQARNAWASPAKLLSTLTLVSVDEADTEPATEAVKAAAIVAGVPTMSTDAAVEA